MYEIWPDSQVASVSRDKRGTYFVCMTNGLNNGYLSLERFRYALTNEYNLPASIVRKLVVTVAK